MTGSIAIPSILSFDFTNAKPYLDAMGKAGVTMLHYDVMDGRFVPDISFGESLFPKFHALGFAIDVHLMVTDAAYHAIRFLSLGAEQVTVHWEAIQADPNGFLAQVEPYRNGRVLGVAINPDTPLGLVIPWLSRFDKAMVMSVIPGASGKPYVPHSDLRVKALREAYDRLGKPGLIEIDGGINDVTGPLAVKAGANILVSGSYLCKAKDPKAAIDAILGKVSGKPGEKVL